MLLLRCAALLLLAAAALFKPSINQFIMLVLL
jgi:hypothetical protein